MEFTTYEVAYRLGVSEETVRRWIRTGLLPAVDQGGKYLIKDEDLQSFLRRRGTPAGRAMNWLATVSSAGVRAAAPGIAFAANNIVTSAALSGLRLYKVLAGDEAVSSDEMSHLLDEIDKSAASLRENLLTLEEQRKKVEESLAELDEIKQRLLQKNRESGSATSST
ncbi:helix-turn-helix domain-containing protein [Ferroacidibacillus organovorans]|uniref:Helix-turn-helix domain-containing protein n=1 Tax=Ferroacidibacillus organovorans TaxID=1765683 RepID=A0A101XTC0_9BACL|nr:helix-turn-helix domain-containing protein [Ferroacidibacillus organovorans]KUO97076.1 hypothetical protein ATW55_12230 [Ferroacidibacillus organovorans]